VRSSHAHTSDGALPAEIARHVVMHLGRAGTVLLLLRLGCTLLLLLLLRLISTIVQLFSIVPCAPRSRHMTRHKCRSPLHRCRRNICSLQIGLVNAAAYMSMIADQKGNIIARA